MARTLSASILVLFIASLISGRAQSPAQQAQNNAKQALQSQLSKEGKDCSDARNNLDDKLCITQVSQQTEQDMATFYQNLKQIIGSPPDLEEAQQAWLVYRQKSCGAIGSFFEGGTGQVGFEARCDIQLTRSRMKDLDAIYNLPLHH